MNKISLASLLLVASNAVAMHSPENRIAEKFFEVIQNGKMEDLDALLGKGLDHTCAYHHNQANGQLLAHTPIMWAIIHHKVEMGEKLLAKYPEKQINGNAGGTLMEHAAFYGSHEFIDLLLYHGAKIDEIVFRTAWRPVHDNEDRREAFLSEIRRIHALKNNR